MLHFVKCLLLVQHAVLSLVQENFWKKQRSLAGKKSATNTTARRYRPSPDHLRVEMSEAAWCFSPSL
jgi:hypothetical protein